MAEAKEEQKAVAEPVKKETKKIGGGGFMKWIKWIIVIIIIIAIIYAIDMFVFNLF